MDQPKSGVCGQFGVEADYRLGVEAMASITGIMAVKLGSLWARARPLGRRFLHKACRGTSGLIPLLRQCRGGETRWWSGANPLRRAGRAALWSIVGASLCALTGVAHAADRPNVLLIVIDDLNDWVGPLGGHPQATHCLAEIATRH
jgi:hypothetical protein